MDEAILVHFKLGFFRKEGESPKLCIETTSVDASELCLALKDNVDWPLINSIYNATKSALISAEAQIKKETGAF